MQASEEMQSDCVSPGSELGALGGKGGGVTDHASAYCVIRAIISEHLSLLTNSGELSIIAIYKATLIHRGTKIPGIPTDVPDHVDAVQPQQT